MAFYFSSETMAFYDTDVFPVASLPQNKVEVTEAVYNDLLTKQNQGYVIKADNSGNPYAVAQGEASATDIKHAGTIATALVLGHVKIGDTMQTAQDGTLDLKDSSVTTEKLTDLSVTTEKIADGAITEEKMGSVKDFAADETTLTKVEDATSVTVGVKDGGIGTQQLANESVTSDKIHDFTIKTNHLQNYQITNEKIADKAVGASKIKDKSIGTNQIAEGGVYFKNLNSGIIFGNDPNYSTNYNSSHSAADLDTYANQYCDGEMITIVFLNNGPNSFELKNGWVTKQAADGSPYQVKRYDNGDYVLVVNNSTSQPLGVRTQGASGDTKSIPVGQSSLFVCVYSGNDFLTDNSKWIPIS